MIMDVSEKGSVLVDQRHNTINTHTPWSPSVCSHVMSSHIPQSTTANGDGMNSTNNNRTRDSRASTGHDDAEQSSFTVVKQKVHASRNKVNVIQNQHANALPLTHPGHLTGSGLETEVLCEESDGQPDAVPFTVEVSEDRTRLVKLYAWIKEEMARSTARSVANQLFQNTGRLLSRTDHEAILHCSWRRDAVEQLLKRVLMGPCGMYEPFMVALRREETTQCHIADKLGSTSVSAADMKAFRELEEYSYGVCVRPESHEPRLLLSDRDYNTCVYHLNNKNTIDLLNDHLLSRLIFSIREHTNIVNCALDKEQRVKELVDTLQLCASKRFRDFCEICTENELSFVVGKLEKRLAGQKRKSNTKYDHTTGEASTSEKRLCLSPAVEYKLVSSLQQEREHVQQQARDLIGFEVETVNNGSIVLQLKPQCADSWQRLKENCHTGRIREFIPVVYRNESNLLPEGEYQLKFTIYEVPSQESLDDKKAMFHLETDTDASETAKKTEKDFVPPSDDNPIEEHMDLLCEELELSPDLLTLLKKEGLVAGNIKAEIDKQGSRAKKIKYLLSKLTTYGSKGYTVLKQYIKTDNEDLYRELETREKVKVIDTAMDTVAKVTKRLTSANHRSVYKKVVFFTGTAVLVVKKKGSTPTKENVSPDQTQLEISCPKILNPVCHFSVKEEEKNGKSGEVTMVLEEAWAVVGADNPPKREILMGKRKQSKPSDQTKKRTHSQEDDDNSKDGTTKPNLTECKELEDCESKDKKTTQEESTKQKSKLESSDKQPKNKGKKS